MRTEGNEKHMIDMHCHILPDVDDGAPDLEMALDMIEEEHSQGIEAIILTPHYRRRMFETPLHVLLEQFELLKNSAAGLGVDLYLGCEYHAHVDMAECYDRKTRPTMAGSRYILTEFSEDTPGRFIREQTRDLRQHGYIPIIAHLERYHAMFENFDFIEELSEGGCKMQINADSIAGKEGFRVSRFCKKMVRYGMLDFVGSDAHDMTVRAPHMDECFRKLCRWNSLEYATEIMDSNPRKILDEAKRNR